MTRLRVLGALLAALGEDGVERPAPGAAPTAFRIWKAGVNVTDHGAHKFTEQSAKLLLDEQAARQNLYSIDCDHMSLDKTSPPESHIAMGWHRLDVRNGELWAVDAEWSQEARAALESKPPKFRYFSPAYEVSKETGEIVSFLNTALTNNPATWSVTALASRAAKGTAMKFQDILAALMGEDGDAKNAAVAALAAAFPDKEGDPDDDKKSEATAKKASEESGDDDKKREETAKAAVDADEKAKAAKDAEETTKAAKVLATIGEQDRRLAELEAVREKEERARIYAARTDLTPSQLKVLDGEPLGKLPKLLELIARPAADPAAAARVTATRGDTRGDRATFGTQRAARLPPAEHKDLVQRMGGGQEEASVHWDPDHPNDLVFPAMSPAAARRILAARTAAGKDGPATNPALRGQGGAR